MNFTHNINWAGLPSRLSPHSHMNTSIFFTKVSRKQSRKLHVQTFVFILQTTAQELAQYFSNFGHVVEAKLIFDENQIPKG